VNCGAIPESLVEAQLFGHVKGAFSGAIRSEVGYLRAASGGTLFLDEIGDLPRPAQATFLRALQEGEVVPVGATSPIKVDLRIVAATHKPIHALAKTGEFRADLLARIAGLRVSLPPVRERRVDIGILLAGVLREVAGERAALFTIAPDAAHLLLEHDWPLNVRELHRAVSVACALAANESHGGTIELARSHFRATFDRMAEPAPTSEQFSEADRALRRSLIQALDANDGNVSETARALGKARTQVNRWLDRFGVDPDSFRRR
jgi:transcriptional regulator with GAF, ATPase, and Fis domain